MKMENFDKLLKLATKRFGKSVFIATDEGNYTYEWSCGKYGESNLESLEALHESVSQGLYKYWLANELMGLEDKEPIPTYQQCPFGEEENVTSKTNDVLKTRSEWAKGKAGDPRKKTNKNRKNKRYTKTQVLGWMRQRTNGRFSSEKITFDQYASEFLTENKKAESRRNWRKAYGKKNAYDDKIIRIQS